MKKEENIGKVHLQEDLLQDTKILVVQGKDGHLKNSYLQEIIELRPKLKQSRTS
jgi:hypothetical protein